MKKIGGRVAVRARSVWNRNARDVEGVARSILICVEVIAGSPWNFFSL
jgi:hypothetical protein